METLHEVHVILPIINGARDLEKQTHDKSLSKGLATQIAQRLPD